jgi:DNA primase
MSDLSTFLDQLKARISLSSVIGRHVKLHKKGREFHACCPFHNEKTPSFTINDDKGFYHCFGCGEHGDAIAFLEKHKGYPFIEAVQELSETVGMQVPKNPVRGTQEDSSNGQKESQGQILRRIMEAATTFFEACLYEQTMGKSALEYALKRGFSLDVLKKFRVGYAPSHGLYHHLKHHFSEENLLAANVVSKSERDGQIYDRFRHRLMFPIQDQRQRVIAFGGRALDQGQEPKYLNSSETLLFHKGHELYALNHCDFKKPLWIMEGYTDVLASHQQGFSQAIATLGTACTEQHIEKIWKRCKAPIFCFDGDGAGRKAAQRIMERVFPLLKNDFTITFAFLPEGEDPDTLLSRNAKEFVSLTQNPTPLEEALWDYLYAEHGMDSPGNMRALMTRIDQWCAQIQDTLLKRFYKEVLSQRFYTKKQELYKKTFLNSSSSLSSSPLHEQPKPSYKKKWTSEKILLAILLNHPTLIEKVSEQVALMDLSTNDMNDIRDALLSIYEDIQDVEALKVYFHTHATKLDISFAYKEELYAMVSFAHPSKKTEDIEDQWMTLFHEHMDSFQAHRQAVLECLSFTKTMDEESWKRLKAIKMAHQHTKKKSPCDE